MDRGLEAVHQTIDLQTRGGVDLGPDATEVFAAASFEYGNIEAMADAVRGC